MLVHYSKLACIQLCGIFSVSDISNFLFYEGIVLVGVMHYWSLNLQFTMS